MTAQQGPISLDKFRKEVDRIGTIEDDATAHAAEDELHQEVLGLIANGEIGPHDAAAFAGLALETLRLDFGRWYE